MTKLAQQARAMLGTHYPDAGSCPGDLAEALAQLRAAHQQNARLRQQLQAAQPAPDTTGFDAAPSRYTANGRETADKMRDTCHALASLTGQDASVLWTAACLTHAVKYLDRHKGDRTTDAEKARWWLAMADHAWYGAEPFDEYPGCPDPRSHRPDFAPYQHHPAPLAVQATLRKLAHSLGLALPATQVQP